jgi:hypothetical protein
MGIEDDRAVAEAGAAALTSASAVPLSDVPAWFDEKSGGAG